MDGFMDVLDADIQRQATGAANPNRHKAIGQVAI
jgi:hypothetical protein